MGVLGQADGALEGCQDEGGRLLRIYVLADEAPGLAAAQRLETLAATIEQLVRGFAEQGLTRREALAGCVAKLSDRRSSR